MSLGSLLYHLLGGFPYLAADQMLVANAVGVELDDGAMDMTGTVVRTRVNADRAPDMDDAATLVDVAVQC